MEDLEVLETQKNYLEFLDHAHDILPRNRNKVWKEMVVGMASDYVDHLNSIGSFEPISFQKVEEITKWPTLRVDEFFIAKKLGYLVNYVSQCPHQKETGKCYDSSLESWKKTPLKERFPDIPVKLAEHWSGIVPEAFLFSLIEVPITTPLGEFFCQKDHIKELLLKRLTKFTAQPKDAKEINFFLDTKHHKKCLDKWLPSLKVGLYDKRSELHQIVFKILSSRNLLTQQEKDTYLTLFILRGPVIGETFDQAWNSLQSLGQNFDRRSNVIEVISKFDPIPDAVFASKNLEKRKVLIRELIDNLPELVNNYAKTCLDYYEGTKSFPNGNPTANCKEFFKVYSKLSKPDDPYIIRLESIRPSPFKL